MDLYALAQDQYQAQLEAVRMAFDSEWSDDEQRDLLLEDLGKARDELERAYLELQLKGS